MKSTAAIAGILLALPGLAPAQVPAPSRVVIVGATVIDGTGRQPLANATVVIEGDRITAVGPSAAVRIPAGARRIEAAGKFVVPGFVDVNVHLSPYDFAVRSITSWSDSAAIGGAVRGARQLLHHGVTTVRDSYGILPILLAARDSMRRDGQPGARVLIAGNVIGWGDFYSYTFSGSTRDGPRDSVTRRLSAALVQGVGENVIDLPADSLGVVIGRYIDRGPDFIKIGVTTHTDDPAPMLFAPRALATLIAVAHARGRKVDAHAGTFEALRTAALAGVDVLQHPETIEYRLTDADAAEIARSGATCALMPRLTTGDRWAAFREHVDAGGRMWPAEMPLAMLRARNDSLRRAGVSPNTTPTTSVVNQQDMRSNAERLISAGCRVAVATDDMATPANEMGRATLASIEGLVDLGMSPMQALVAATANGAAAAGGEGRFGTIAPGMAADLLVLSRSPLDDIRNIRSVETILLGGRVVR